MKKVFHLLTSLLVLSLLSCTQKQAESLDGKTFQIGAWEVGKPDKQDPDVVSFANGQMDSEACHQYGFSPAPYTVELVNGKLSFKCTTKSESEGEIDFEGSYSQNTIEGKFVWRKEGQDNINYEFKGSLKPN
ncbi:MAG: hypothetical protein IPM34_00230 [Saprospiraceae bacterium]|nr:hypothetical protein [Saprospiraceae bacterium]